MRRLLSSIAILCHPVLVMAGDYPVGISLGHTELSSAYYTATKELKTVTKISSSNEWQDYFMMTLRDGRKHAAYYDPETLAMFSRTLEQITAATETLIQRPVQISAINAPMHFAQMSSMSTLVRAGENAGFVTISGSQVISHSNGARLAYNLDSCEGYGLPDTCKLDDDEDNFVVVLDYGKNYFSMSFVHTEKFINIPIGEMYLTTYGENDIGSFLSNLDSQVTSSLIGAIREFITEQLEKAEQDVRNASSHVRAVILSGDASKSSMKDMQQVLANVLPQFQDRFRFSIDPGFVGAAGAAHRACQTVTDPLYIEPRDPIHGQILEPNPEHHREL